MKLFLTVATFFFSTLASANTVYVGRFVLPERIKKSFCVYFNGACVPVEHKTYLIAHEFALSQLCYLFVDQGSVTYEIDEESTTPLFRVKNNAVYAAYLLTKVSKGMQYEWLIQKAEFASPIVPLNTLIVFIDPQKTDITLIPTQWKARENRIALPKIQLQGEGLEDQLIESCLALTVKPFHAQPKKAELQCADKCKVVVINP